MNNFNKKIYKLILKTKILDLDLEEINELNFEFEKKFQEDFYEELLFLKLTNENNTNKTKDIEIKKESPNRELFKFLYKELIFIYHPDRNKDDKNSYNIFMQLQESWVNEDYYKLIEISLNSNIDLNKFLNSESINVLETQIENKNLKILNCKNTLKWVWCNSKQNEKIKNLILKKMNINLEEFNIWKNKNKNLIKIFKNKKLNNEIKKIEFKNN
jgi:hypothetical protein